MIHKTTRSILSVLLAALLLVTSIPLTPAFAGDVGSVSPQSESAEGRALEKDDDGVYQIATAEELRAFAEKVNDGETTANAVLTANIDLNNQPWYPIGSEDHLYTGTFDGQNFKISGLTINSSSANYQGLFGYVGTGGTVKDLTVSGTVSGGMFVGGVVGYNNGGTVTGCIFSGSGSVSGNSYVGGVVGVVGVVGDSSGTVKNCYNTGDVTGGSYVGGVVGQNSGSVENSYNTGNISGDISVGSSGGVVGWNSGSVENCYNTGSVTSSGSNVGGVVGYNVGPVKNCYNIGEVSGSGIYVGGVVGYNNSGIVTNCYNTGTVSSNSNISDVGGVVGYNGGSVTNCYNTGTVSSNSNIRDVGGVVGLNGGSGTVTGCYFLTGTAGSGIGGGIGNARGLTADEFKNQISFTDWDFGIADTWSIHPVLGRPVLNENKEGGLGTDKSPYEISTADELENFRDLVNRGGAGASAHAKLMNNIDLNPNMEISEDGTVTNGDKLDRWTPIGNSESTAYTGTFDGNGKTISGLYIYNSTADYQGLFGYVSGSGKIENLSVSGSVSGKIDVGGVVGDNSGTVENCYNTGNISGNSVGGVVGDNRGTVENCYNTGNISGLDSGTGNRVGGVVGWNDSGATVENCYNTGSVNVSGNSSAVGGVVGCNQGGSVQNCYNTGTVTGLDSGTSNYVGGVVGWNSGNVTNCYNTDSITVTGSGGRVGGVVGDNRGTVTNCYNIGDVSGTSNYVGGVVGYNSGSASVTNCYYQIDKGATVDIGGTTKDDTTTVAKTAAEFQSGEVAYLLQGTQTTPVWGQSNLTEEDSWPTLIALDKNAKTVYKVITDFGYDEQPDNVSYTNNPAEPAPPSRDGYTFGGWDQTAEEGNTITFTAKWTPHTYSITASPSALDFGSITEGEERPAAQNVTITNSGNQTVTLTQPTANNFEITKSDSLTLAPNATATFTVQPKAGLAAGSYSEEITITGSNDVILKITATLTVSASDPEPTPTPTPDPTPSGPSTGDSTGWDDILDELENTAKGDQITIDMGDETKVPAEIFESLAGKDVDVTFDLGDDLSWTVNGKDIPDDAALADLDLGVALDTDGIPVNVINTITGEVGTVQITLAHNGEFGFTMTLTAPLGKENAGYWANLYHYKVNGGEADREDPLGDDEDAEALNFEAAAKIDETGSVTIPFSHASQYAIVIDTHSHATVDVSDIFIDVAPDAWYKDAVQYAYDQGLMTGVSDTEFAPEATTTRAMIVSILARLENVTTAQAAGFADVDDNDWYATAVNWAANVGVVNGYEDNTFRPNTAITREQLAAILMNYAAYKGYDVSARADLSHYSDADSISSWANDVLLWAVAEGLLTGVTDDTIAPQAHATRAQVAAILQRFLSE